MGRWVVMAAALLAATAGLGAGGDAPRADLRDGGLTVTGRQYRLRLATGRCAVGMDLRDAQGAWRRVAAKGTELEWAFADGPRVQTTSGAPARWRHVVRGEAVVVGLTTPLAALPPVAARIHLVCRQEGVLVGFELVGAAPADGVCWPLPRVRLDEAAFTGYAFWNAADERRAGSIASLGRRDVYAGVSAWGGAGDTAPRLSERHPALVATGPGGGLGVVLLDYAGAWAGSFSFVQRYGPGHSYLYGGHARAAAAGKGLWAWLAPFGAGEADAAAVERLVALGARLRKGFEPVAPEPDEAWVRPLPDFPRELRRARPVADVADAAVFTINESIHSDYGLALARKVGSDVLIRGWFKWRDARDYAKSAHLVPQVHGLGALFGGGITCSALYDGENGLTAEQVRDMATRGPDGKLVDAWGAKGIRHGSLSCPAYLEYLLSWCRKQIDAGVDTLFMDEINAALRGNEGFDDYSVRDFRAHLVWRYCEGEGWTAKDARWTERFGIDLGDRGVCADGTVGSFAYRAYLASRGFVGRPHARGNPLSGEWHAFRLERDDRAWKHLCDGIRAYAASRGRRVFISGNGIAPYVDLQVLGVWGRWRVKDGRVDLSGEQLQEWASIVDAGHARAGRRVPVVLFHDWGFGGFPWLKVPPGDRRLWMRVRGAEIAAAGGYFAFPVHGPFGNDALRDGTLGEVARQTAFYQRNRALTLGSRLLGFEPLTTEAPLLSLALWRRGKPPALVLHVVNRKAEGGKLVRRGDVAVGIPTGAVPRAVRVVSPDWEGERAGTARRDGAGVTVVVPEVEAYAVALLEYDALPRVALAGRRVVPTQRWARPPRSEFTVGPGGVVGEAWALNGFMQGNLHPELRNPPTFLVCMPRGGVLRVHVRAVATLGAKLECLVDGKGVETVVLADRDGRNEGGAAEYDRTVEVAIPAGRHRVRLRNTGGDWMTIGWYSFVGDVEPWREESR